MNESLRDTAKMKVSTVLRLVESKSAPLYHGTTIENAEEILTVNRLTARTDVDATALPHMRGSKSNTRSISFSRSLSAARGFVSGSPRRTGITGVVFVIDQQLLSRDIGKRLNPYNDILSYSDDNISRSAYTEYEETVLGDIPNFNKYITQIIVYVHPQYADLVDPQSFPKVLSDPRMMQTTNTTIKDTTRATDRFASARELELHQARSNNNV